MFNHTNGDKKSDDKSDSKRFDDKKIDFLDVFSVSQLIGQLIWCIIFMLGIGALTFMVVKTCGDGVNISVVGSAWVISVETAIIVFVIFTLSIIFKYIIGLKNIIDEDNEIISNVVGATMLTCFDDVFTIKKVTPVFYTLLGYSEGDIRSKYHSEFNRMLVGEESKLEFARQKRLLREKGYSQAQYKVRCGDGAERWISSRSRLTRKRNGERIVYTVLFDISDEKTIQEKLILAEKRNKIVFENINSGILEWDIINNTLQVSDQLLLRFGARGENNIGAPDVQRVVHPEDFEILKDMTDSIRSGERDKMRITMRLRCNDGEFTHCDLNLIAIRDNNSVPVRAVGIVIDVEEQFKLEAELRHKADIDPLTGIYNKGATQKLVENTLEIRDSQQHALIMFDMDNFKSVNDTFGHGAGDVAIKTIADLLRKIFERDSIIGRIGGDEFMVMCRNIEGDINGLCDKFERLKAENPHVESGGRVKPLTLSIGAALYPNDAKNYTDLYRNADIALYKAKRDGKNRYVFFEND